MRNVQLTLRPTFHRSNPDSEKFVTIISNMNFHFSCPHHHHQLSLPAVRKNTAEELLAPLLFL